MPHLPAWNSSATRLFPCVLSFASPPGGRGRETMTCGRVPLPGHKHSFDGAVASHLAELVRADFFARKQGSLIRPYGPPSPPGGEGAWPPFAQNRKDLHRP